MSKRSGVLAAHRSQVEARQQIGWFGRTGNPQVFFDFSFTVGGELEKNLSGFFE